jgi:hypothetical protein
VAVLVSLAVLPIFVGGASAAPAPLTVANSPPNHWAYGGVGWSNKTLIVGSDKLTWSASFGWTAIFTETNTSATTVQIEEQRTVGIHLTATFANPTASAKYTFHGYEVDIAFANLTDAATVYVAGTPVAALGIINDSTSITGGINESITVTSQGTTKSASLAVAGWAHTSAQFTPALGLLPRNLTGVTMWNSTSTIYPKAEWNITYSWTDNGFYGATGSGTRYADGTISRPGPVNLTGFDVTRTYATPVFADHVPRVAIILIVQGPLGSYDAFVLVPRAFDLFGTEVHPYDSNALGSASISAQTLFVSSGAYGPTVTAGATTFGAGTTAISTLTSSSTGVAPAATLSPGMTVTGAPISLAEATSVNDQLIGRSTGAANVPAFGAGALALAAALVVAVVVGMLALVKWRSHERHPTRADPAGPYGSGGSDGAPSTVPAPVAPTPGVPATGGPTAPKDSEQRL